MKYVRRWIYNRGFRPPYGSFFYSPSLSLLHSLAEEALGEKIRMTFEKGAPHGRR